MLRYPAPIFAHHRRWQRHQLDAVSDVEQHVPRTRHPQGICLEDGKKLKMLKRHLHSAYGMTPADYRARWDLPQDYPMVAPNYAEKRSALAKQIGLGRKGEKAAEAGTAANVPEVRCLPEHNRRRNKA